MSSYVEVSFNYLLISGQRSGAPCWCAPCRRCFNYLLISGKAGARTDVADFDGFNYLLISG
ncbi:MAG: hypothetical protein ACP5H5_10510 [Pyrobaculum sp.]